MNHTMDNKIGRKFWVDASSTVRSAFTVFYTVELPITKIRKHSSVGKGRHQELLDKGWRLHSDYQGSRYCMTFCSESPETHSEALEKAKAVAAEMATTGHAAYVHADIWDN
jgi:hypothetical protein